MFLKKLITNFLIFVFIHATMFADQYTPMQVLAYHFNSAIQWNTAMRALHDHPLLGNENVLHLGCKDGKISAHLADQLPEGNVLGIDPSTNMIAFAKAWFPSNQHVNLCFEVNDAARMNYDQKFDTIFSFSTLYSNKEHKQCAKKIYSSLKFGEKAVITEPQMSENDHFGLFIKLISSERWCPFFADYLNKHVLLEAPTLERLLRTAGFTVVNVQMRKNETNFDTVDDFRDWLWPQLNFSSDEDRHAFLDEYIALVIEQFPPDADGKITVFTRNLQAVANKILFDDRTID